MLPSLTPRIIIHKGVVIFPTIDTALYNSEGILISKINKGRATAIIKTAGLNAIFFIDIYFLSCAITAEATVQPKRLMEAKYIFVNTTASVSGNTACKIGTPKKAQFPKVLAIV